MHGYRRTDSMVREAMRDHVLGLLAEKSLIDMIYRSHGRNAGMHLARNGEFLTDIDEILDLFETIHVEYQEHSAWNRYIELCGYAVEDILNAYTPF